MAARENGSRRQRQYSDEEKEAVVRDASTPGCCYGDGPCCSCVAKACGDWALGDEPGVPEFTACVCQDRVCASSCQSACAAGGIDVSCLPCIDEALNRGACVAELAACQGK